MLHILPQHTSNKTASRNDHAPKHRRHLIAVMVMVALTGREQQVLYRLLADVHRCEDQVHGLRERHDGLHPRIPAKAKEAVFRPRLPCREQDHSPVRPTRLGAHLGPRETVWQDVPQDDAKRVEHDPIS